MLYLKVSLTQEKEHWYLALQSMYPYPLKSRKKIVKTGQRPIIHILTHSLPAFPYPSEKAHQQPSNILYYYPHITNILCYILLTVQSVLSSGAQLHFQHPLGSPRTWIFHLLVSDVHFLECLGSRGEEINTKSLTYKVTLLSQRN